MNTHIFVCHMHLLWPVYKVSNHTVREQNRNNIRRLGRLITNRKQREKTGILSWDTGQGLGRPSFSSWLGQRLSWASEKLLFRWQAKVSRDEITCQFVCLNSTPKDCATYSFTVEAGRKCSATIRTYYVYK